MVKKWLPRILAALPSIFIAIHGDQFGILPQSFMNWKKAHMIESVIGVGLLWWACTMTVLWLQRGMGLNNLKKDKERAEQVLDDWRNSNIPDLPFGEAVELIRQFRPNQKVTNYQIEEQIVKMAFHGKIMVWGEPLLALGMTSESGNKVEIPKEFFFSVNWGRTENDGYVFKIFNSLPNWKDYHKHEEYVNVILNRAQVMAAFASKEL